MGRKVDTKKVKIILQTIADNDGQVRANDIARQLKMHPQAVARLLPNVDQETGELLYEDDKGFLGIFRQ